MKESAITNPKMRHAISQALAAKPKKEDNRTWEELIKNKNQIGTMVYKTLLVMRESYKQEVFKKAIEGNADQVALFRGLTDELRDCNSSLKEMDAAVDGRSGLILDKELDVTMELSQSLMDIYTKSSKAHQTITSIFARILDEDYNDRLTDEVAAIEKSKGDPELNTVEEPKALPDTAEIKPEEKKGDLDE
jgi:hypothetical protein